MIKLQQGFSLVSVIFLLVVIAALVTFAVTLSTTQQQSAALDVMGARAVLTRLPAWGYNGARIRCCRTLRAHSLPLVREEQPPSRLPPCRTLLAGFNVNMVCTANASSEAAATVTMYQLTSTASAAVTTGNVGRQISVTMATNKYPVMQAAEYGTAMRLATCEGGHDEYGMAQHFQGRA